MGAADVGVRVPHGDRHLTHPPATFAMLLHRAPPAAAAAGVSFAVSIRRLMSTQGTSQAYRDFMAKPGDRALQQPLNPDDYYVPAQIANRGGKNPIAKATVKVPDPHTSNGRVRVAEPFHVDDTQQLTAPMAAAAATALPAHLAAPAATPAGAGGPTDLTLGGEVRWLYRVFQKHARLLPNASARVDARREIARQFRANVGVTVEVDIQRHVDTAYSKLSFTRMSTPRQHHPRLDYVPPFPRAKELFGDAAAGPRPGVQTYQYSPYGELTVDGASASRRVVRGVFNSQGVTDDQVKRHHALVERMHFRGPHWAGKPKY